MENNNIYFVLSILCLVIILALILCADYSLTLGKIKPRIRIRRRYINIALLILSFLVFWLCNNHRYNAYNNYSYFARALLEGHLDVPDMPSWLESVTFEGKVYMHFAPGVALLSIPFVAIFGVEGFNCAVLAMVLGACNMVLAVQVLRNMKIGANRRDQIWLGAMLVFGTVHFFCASQGSSWFLGHVSTLFFLLVALVYFTKGKKEFPYENMFWAGLFFGLAVTCRMAALFGFVFFAGYLILKDKRWIKSILVFCCGAAVFGGLYMAYNFVRFGTIMDMGYQLTYLKDMHREVYDALQAAPISEQRQLLRQYKAEYGGPLQMKFIANNLYSIFFLPPAFQKEFPYIIPTLAGVAVTYTSPMLYCAALADWKDKKIWLLGITMVLTAMPFLMNYGNGMAQFGMRYSMDFTPYLWLMMCYGLTRKGRLKSWMKIGIALCILIQGWGTLFWTYFYC